MQDLLANIAEMLTARVKSAARRRMGSALLVGLALLFAAVAICAGIAAGGVVLAARWGALAACLVIGAAALAVAVVLMVVVTQQAKAARLRHQIEVAQWRQAIQAAKAIVPDMAAGKVLLIATALGLVAGVRAGRQTPRD